MRPYFRSKTPDRTATMDSDIMPATGAPHRSTEGRTILMLIGLALITRLPYFFLPVQGDEAAMYTWYCANVDHPVLNVVRHYHGPHNHVLHSVLFAGLYEIVGCGFPWLRLPALLASSACVPLTYAVLRRMIGRGEAIVATTIVAFSGWAIHYGADARGYSLAMMLGLIAVGLAWRGRRGRSPAYIAAAGIAGGAAVGTVPTLIHLAAAIGIWLVISSWHSGRRRRASTVWYAALFAVSAMLTAGALYAPILSFMGWDVLWRYPDLHAQPYGQLLPRLPQSLIAHAHMFSDGPLPTAIYCGLAALGVVRLSKRTSFLFLATILIVPVFLTLILRRIPPVRTMTFLLPYVAAPAAVGAVLVTRSLLRHLGAVRSLNVQRKGRVYLAVLALSIIAVITYAVRWPVSLPGVQDRPDVAPAARFLARQIDQDVFIFARTGVSEPIQYHLARLDLPFFGRVGLPPRHEVVKQGVLVRQRGEGLGSMLSQAMRSFRQDRLLFEDSAYQVWRVVRSGSESLARIDDANGEGL